ncbi:hypothetical protein FSP39_015833 [Pinctada imbricata]|uniref:Uncharacterized protein n=1 Tax=Pinctada imbricata TaxID=66713 RepID=A0AA88XRM8_PINIB|nr:hypothetical protein FSP39_015833 [Pinctada imbricata]
MNQNTILIMIVVGLAVVIFLIVLYCFQQRQRHRHGRYRSTTLGEEEVSADRVSLFLPPPTYEEVITTNLYPPTPEMQLRQQHGQERINSFDEPSPITPPPTYHTALAILARSHESVLQSKLTVPTRRLSSSRVTRRSVSMDHLGSNRPQTQNSNSDICEQLEDDVFTKTCDDSNVTSINR